MKKKFEREITLSNKVIYKDIGIGKKREQLLKDAMSGKITQEEMRKIARTKEYKYLYSELPEWGEVIN